MTSFFEPRHVAVIGASRDPGKIGYAVLHNILSGGYGGAVYPVNPGGGDILGLPSYRDIGDVPGEIDVACLTIPSRFVFDAVRRCADRGVRHGIIVSAGFSEVGNGEEEQRIVAYAKDRGMRILGPNVFGAFSAVAKFNATFVSGTIPEGRLAMITQSGALGLTMVGQATVENIGLSCVVSVGNKADIDESDLLEYLCRQERTHAILLYIEGIRNGERFVQAVREATRRKPVVVIKSGRSRRGAMAAASHTGSLAGSDEVFDDIIRQCGALRAESTRDAFQWCKFLAGNTLPAGDHTVIITNGGGAGVMATDACEKHGVLLYDDAAALKTIFGPVTPPIGSTKNPIDITGQAAASDYSRAFAAALGHRDIHTVLGVYCETNLFTANDLNEAVETHYRKFQEQGKILIFSLFGGPRTADYERDARRRGIPVTDDVYDAVSCLGAAYRYRRYLSQPPGEPADAPLDRAAIEAVVEDARRQGRAFLLAPEARQVMAAAGIAVPESRKAQSLDEAVAAAAAIGFPVVMKVVSRDILHKSDAGGIALDLEDEGEVVDAYGAILRNCRAHAPHAAIEGVEVAKMVPAGTELIVGARIDRIFGPIVMVGLGGIYVEVMKDVSFRAFPLDRKEALSMIEEIRSYPLLMGVRGEKTKDIGAVADAIVTLGTLIRTCRGISDIEVNPLVVYERGSGALAVDVRIILTRDPPASAGSAEREGCGPDGASGPTGG